MKRLLLATALAIAATSPIHAFEIGDSVSFPTDSSFGCNLIEDARQATAHIERYGSSKETSTAFMREIYDSSVRQPVPYVIPKRFCSTFIPGINFFSANGDRITVKYHVLKKTDDGYACLGDPQFGEATEPSGFVGCVWTNLQIWNVQVGSK